MSSTTLFDAVMNNKRDYDAVLFAVKSLRRAVDECAERIAKENAEWHDDPAADDHAAFHAPAIEQFPRKTRDEAVLSLVKYWMAEIR